MKDIIVQKEDPVLRMVAEEVPIEQIGMSDINDIVTRMKKALAGQADGVAIAAPQIGEPVRIFVVAGKVFSPALSGEKEPEGEADENTYSDMVFINPVISKLSRRKVSMDEGCLSVRRWYGKVRRAEKATVRAYNEEGVLFERGGSGLLAQIFQHEVDHLDGVLFIDKAVDLQEVSPEDAVKKN